VIFHLIKVGEHTWDPYSSLAEETGRSFILSNANQQKSIRQLPQTSRVFTWFQSLGDDWHDGMINLYH